MRGSRIIANSITMLVGLLFVATLLSSENVWAQPPAHVAHQPTKAEWRRSMVKTPTQSGCFKVSYPNTTWEEVGCSAAVAVPYRVARGIRPTTVGDGNDWAATVASGSISSSEGSFPLVSNLTSEIEIDPQNNGSSSGIVGSNLFSLQLNTQFFATTACAGGSSYCQGWVQFLYSASVSSGVLIEYTLLNYTTSSSGCPYGWTAYETPVDGQDYYTCFLNTPSTSVPSQSITNLSQLTLTGAATANGTDEVILSTGGGTLYKLSHSDSTLNLATAWTTSEFNVFGDCCGYEASFNVGATLIVHTAVDNGTTSAPSCPSNGYTGEIINLSLVSPCCPYGGAVPGIAFMESSSTTMTPTCSYLEHPYAWLTPVSNLLLQ